MSDNTNKRKRSLGATVAHCFKCLVSYVFRVAYRVAAGMFGMAVMLISFCGVGIFGLLEFEWAADKFEAGMEWGEDVLDSVLPHNL